MGTVTLLAFAFIALSLVYKTLKTRLVIFLKGNIKYRFLDALASYVHYGPDIGVDETLKLDNPSEDVLVRRKKGQAYLAAKLAGDGGDEGPDMPGRGAMLAAKLVDCRFALSKVLFPLLRELEFAPRRNFLCSLYNGQEIEVPSKKSSHNVGGMHRVTTDSNEDLLYVGNDAVQTLGIHSFYQSVQEEINRRMILPDSNLRFAPISLNPELEKNVEKILTITKMDQMRYSLSGSEAVDAAIKDVRASCRGKRVVVRFTSAYHGHVSGVDFLNCGADHIFLGECDPNSIEFIEKYHHMICAVIVNPMQHFTGINKPSPPGEKLTMGARKRDGTDKNKYAEWLHALRAKCNYCTQYLSRVAFIVDDIYFAFRTPELFSSNYFVHPATQAALRPDVLILGKGVAAGYPLSMVLGRTGFLNTYDKKYLLQVNKTVGTLAAWYGGLVASNVFLENITSDKHREHLESMVTKFDAFSTDLNQKFNSKGIPLEIRNFSNVFTINFLSHSLYNCRYPQYLLAEGIYLGNYSTGKFNMNDDASEGDLTDLSEKFAAAGSKMRDHGYFESGNSCKVLIVSKVLARFAVNYARLFGSRIMEDKRIDIEVSHNHPVNKFGHFWSSVFMILCAYPCCWYGEYLCGCVWFFGTHIVRQAGHFFYEKQDRNVEKLKFGHKDGSKKNAVAFLVVAGVAYYYRLLLWEFANAYVNSAGLELEQYVSIVALLTILPHFVEIVHEWGLIRGLSWLLKILTDPFTDLLDFYEYWVINPALFLDLKDFHASYQLDVQSKKIVKVS